MRKILNLDGTIKKGAEEPDIPDEELLKWYDVMVQVRTLDAKGIRLQRQGRVGFHIFTTGQEAHIGIAAALNSDDWIFPAYREHGAALYRGLALEKVVNHLFANDRDTQKGRRLPGLFGEKSINFVNPSAPIGTQIVQATGASYAGMEFNPGEVTAVFFGDGATSSNDFHSGVNFAGVYKAPTIFVCMNNQFAISVPIEKQTAAEKIVDKAVGYGVPGERVDGNDILAMYEVAKEAVERGRNGEGPTFIEAFTYRLGPHTSSDDPSRYREDEDVENWQKKDPMVRFKNYLTNKGILTEDTEKALWDKYDKLVNKLIEEADKRPKPKMETMFTDVYEELPWHLKEQWEEVKYFTEDD
ncbi:MAG: thiamine pyrophosphate-dependent dehydrogenase E1 component subunit alpha [Candidatus Kariarchaeaceae archaeon]|jgi:2-oxoisovalerate dehydrogenase E1 component alpha subunit